MTCHIWIWLYVRQSTELLLFFSPAKRERGRINFNSFLAYLCTLKIFRQLRTFFFSRIYGPHCFKILFTPLLRCWHGTLKKHSTKMSVCFFSVMLNAAHTIFWATFCCLKTLRLGIEMFVILFKLIFFFWNQGYFVRCTSLCVKWSFFWWRF